MYMPPPQRAMPRRKVCTPWRLQCFLRTITLLTLIWINAKPCALAHVFAENKRHRH